MGSKSYPELSTSRSQPGPRSGVVLLCLLSRSRQDFYTIHPGQPPACEQSWGHLPHAHALGAGKGKEALRTLKHDKWFPSSPTDSNWIHPPFVFMCLQSYPPPSTPHPSPHWVCPLSPTFQWRRRDRERRQHCCQQPKTNPGRTVIWPTWGVQMALFLPRNALRSDCPKLQGNKRACRRFQHDWKATVHPASLNP